MLDGSVSRTVDLLVRASDCLKTDVTLMLSSDQVRACVCVCECDATFLHRYVNH